MRHVGRVARAAPALCRGVSALQHQSLLNSSTPFAADRHTKIVATLGPASMSRLPELIRAGMNVARINCAHGDEAQYVATVKALRKAELAVRAERITTGLCGSRHDVVALAFDVKGPEIRVGARVGVGGGVAACSFGGAPPLASLL